LGLLWWIRGLLVKSKKEKEKRKSKKDGKEMEGGGLLQVNLIDDVGIHEPSGSLEDEQSDIAKSGLLPHCSFHIARRKKRRPIQIWSPEPGWRNLQPVVIGSSN